MDQIKFIEKCYDRIDNYYSNLEKKNKQLNNDIKELGDTISSYKSQLAKLGDETEKINSEKSILKGEIDKLSEELKTIESFKSEINELKTQSDNYNNKSKRIIFIVFAVCALILLIFGICESDQTQICIGGLIGGLIVLLIWAVLICFLYRTPKNSDDF